MILLLLAITIIAGCKHDASQDSQSPKDISMINNNNNNNNDAVEEPGVEVTIGQLSDLFNMSIEVMCKYIDQNGNEGKLYAKNMSYRIENIQPNVGQIINFYEKGMLYTIGISQTEGTVMNVSEITPLLERNSNKPILALDGLQHRCRSFPLPDQLFLVPTTTKFKDITEQFKDYFKKKK